MEYLVGRQGQPTGAQVLAMYMSDGRAAVKIHPFQHLAKGGQWRKRYFAGDSCLSEAFLG